MFKFSWTAICLCMPTFPLSSFVIAFWVIQLMDRADLYRKCFVSFCFVLFYSTLKVQWLKWWYVYNHAVCCLYNLLTASLFYHLYFDHWWKFVISLEASDTQIRWWWWLLVVLNRFEWKQESSRKNVMMATAG